jgi:Trk K+ transport system NAD-binding subunit
VVARAHSNEGADYLRKVGADVVILGEDELGRAMSRALETPASA